MQLAIALAIIASVLLPNHEIDLPGDSLFLRAVCSVLVGIVPILFARSYSRRIETSEIETSKFVQDLKKYEVLFLGVWGSATSVLLGVFRWDLCVRSYQRLGESALFSQLIILLPILIPVLAFWWTVAKTEDCHLRALRGGRDKTMGTSGSLGWKENLSFVWIQARLMIILPLVPVLAILLIDDCLKLAPGADQYRVVFFGSLVAALPFILPSVLRKMWRLESLASGEKRDRVQAIVQQVGVFVSDICLWRTGNRCINAAVAGAFRRSRILLISDALLDTFTDSDLDAVVAHEIAHVKHRHVSTMLWSLVAAGLTAVMCSQIIDQSDWQALSTEQSSLLIMLPVLSTWLLVHRFISRSFEYQADLEACRTLASIHGTAENTSTIEATVNSYIQMLKKLAPAGTSGADWWHPSIDSRIERLRQIHSNEEKLATFEMVVTAINRMVRGGVAILMLVTIGLALIQV